MKKARLKHLTIFMAGDEGYRLNPPPLVRQKNTPCFSGFTALRRTPRSLRSLYERSDSESHSHAKTGRKSPVLAWLALQDLIRNPEQHTNLFEQFNTDLAKSIIGSGSLVQSATGR